MEEKKVEQILAPLVKFQLLQMLLKFVDLVQLLPREIHIVATEMAIGGSGFIDGALKIKIPYYGSGSKVEYLRYNLGKPLVIHLSCAIGVYHD